MTIFPPKFKAKGTHPLFYVEFDGACFAEMMSRDDALGFEEFLMDEKSNKEFNEAEQRENIEISNENRNKLKIEAFKELVRDEKAKARHKGKDHPERMDKEAAISRFKKFLKTVISEFLISKSTPTSDNSSPTEPEASPIRRPGQSGK